MRPELLMKSVGVIALVALSMSFAACARKDHHSDAPANPANPIIPVAEVTNETAGGEEDIAENEGDGGLEPNVVTEADPTTRELVKIAKKDSLETLEVMESLGRAGKSRRIMDLAHRLRKTQTYSLIDGGCKVASEIRDILNDQLIGAEFISFAESTQGVCNVSGMRDKECAKPLELASKIQKANKDLFRMCLVPLADVKLEREKAKKLFKLVSDYEKSLSSNKKHK